LSNSDDVLAIQQICAFELGMFRTSH